MYTPHRHPAAVPAPLQTAAAATDALELDSCYWRWTTDALHLCPPNRDNSAWQVERGGYRCARS